jgi:hypothetical protein
MCASWLTVLIQICCVGWGRGLPCRFLADSASQDIFCGLRCVLRRFLANSVSPESQRTHVRFIASKSFPLLICDCAYGVLRLYSVPFLYVSSRTFSLLAIFTFNHTIRLVSIVSLL